MRPDAEAYDSTSTTRHWIRTDTVYDANGRVQKNSRPYFLAGQTVCGTGTYCTVFTLDDLGRVLSAAAPDGGVVSTAYHGLSTTATVHIVSPVRRTTR